MEAHTRTAPKVTVVLVDDHELAREGTKHMLSRDSRIEVVGEAAGSREGISLIAALQPDVAIVDVRLREGSGIDIVNASRGVASKTRILILSAYDDDRYVRSLMRVGVRGYLMKTASAGELREAVHDVAEGHLVFPRDIADKVLSILRGDKRVNGRAQTNGHLTARESEVLERMGDGLSNREIGSALGISLKTVEAHVQRVLLKLGAASRTQAVASVLRSSGAL